MKRYLVCSILISVACTSIFAQKKKPASDPCKNPMTQAEINLCTHRSFEAADADMITVLALVKKEVSSYEGAFGKA